MKQIVTHLERRERSKRFPIVSYTDVIDVGGKKYTIATFYTPAKLNNDQGNAATTVLSHDFKHSGFRFHGWLLTEEELVQRHLAAVNDFLSGDLDYLER